MILKLNIFQLIFINNLLILKILSNPLTNYTLISDNINNKNNNNYNNVNNIKVISNNNNNNNNSELINTNKRNVGGKLVQPTNLSDLLSNYRKVQRQKTRDDIRNYATIGLITGTLRVEDKIKENIKNMSEEFYGNFNCSTPEQNWQKLYEMEKTIERDRRAIQILGTTLDFARNAKTFRQFKNDIKQISKQNEIASVKLAKRKFNIYNRNIKRENGVNPDIDGKDSILMREQLNRQARGFRNFIDIHINNIHYLISNKTDEAIKYIRSMKNLNLNDFNIFGLSNSSPSMMSSNGNINNNNNNNNINNNNNNNNNNNINNNNNNNNNNIGSQKPIVIHFNEDIEELKAENFNIVQKPINEIYIHSVREDREDDFEGSGGDESNFIERTKRQDRQNDKKPEIKGNRNQKQEDIEGELYEGGPSGSGSDEAPPTGGGGLVGLIASLSGGEGGSDIGALVGALTGVISNLFGPGGLDVQSLIGTGTSLISGLLAGQENFGKVLGSYIGTAVDGLSGGGGAINNGQFIGQFVGTVLAQLSADPEDDDKPPQPVTFIQSVFSGIKLAKNKAPAGSAEESAEGASAEAGGGAAGGGKSATFLGYLSNMVTSIVGHIANSVLNASLGLAAGASQGIAGFSAGSSQGKHGDGNAKSS